MAYYQGSLPETSNRASYIECFQLTDIDGQPVDLTQAQEIALQIVAEAYPNFTQFGYGLGFGGYIGAQLLTATLSGGKIVLIQPGIFQVSFARSEMNTLPGGLYNVGIAITIDDETAEIFVGTLPVREGVVTVQAGAH